MMMMSLSSRKGRSYSIKASTEDPALISIITLRDCLSRRAKLLNQVCIDDLGAYRDNCIGAHKLTREPSIPSIPVPSRNIETSTVPFASLAKKWSTLEVGTHHKS